MKSVIHFRTIISSFLVVFLLFCGLSANSYERIASEKADLQVVGFDMVKRVFEAGSCNSCHSPTKPSAGIIIGTYDEIMSQVGLVVPGKPEFSLLYQSIADGIMPPFEPLSSLDVEIVRSWIADGAQPESQGIE